MRLELARVSSLYDFQLVMTIYQTNDYTLLQMKENNLMDRFKPNKT